MNDFILFDIFLIYIVNIVNMLDEFSVTHYLMTHRDGFCDLLMFGLAMFFFLWFSIYTINQNYEFTHQVNIPIL